MTAWIDAADRATEASERAEKAISRRRERDRARRAKRGKASLVTSAGTLAGILGEAEDLPAIAKPLYGGRLRAPDAYRRKLEGTRFVFTCAQNNTELHKPFWASLQQYCIENNAQLAVSRITYNKKGWAAHGGISKKIAEEDNDIWYADEIESYTCDEQVKVARDLIFCGELDILPSAVYPLSGLQDYSGPNSAIIPHTKMQMQSLATMKHDFPKMLYTSGACTLRNYIQRKTGQIAEFHHVYGALVVEVDQAGDWFARQINAGDDGVFYDLNKVYTPVGVMDAADFGRPIINLGDIHVEHLDHDVMKGADDMLEVLNPASIMLHDLIDFKYRNHHNRKDPQFLSQMYWDGTDRVDSSFKLAYDFVLGLKQRLPTTQLFCIRSNHDNAYHRWLVDPTSAYDGPNLEFWHRSNARLHRAIKERDTDFDIYKWAFTEYNSTFQENIENVLIFVREDESLVINGIEYGMHGHLGPNGARGNPKAYKQIGRRANTGHTHSAGIIDGIYTSGLLSRLDLGYNVGPSSWSTSHIVTYPNGKRAIITQRGNKWRASI